MTSKEMAYLTYRLQGKDEQAAGQAAGFGDEAPTQVEAMFESVAQIQRFYERNGRRMEDVVRKRAKVNAVIDRLNNSDAPSNAREVTRLKRLLVAVDSFIEISRLESVGT